MYGHHDHVSNAQIAPGPTLQQGTPVWVWDSTWLPAVVVDWARLDCLLVRLEHGVTFRAALADVAVRDAASRGSDVPRFRSRLTH